MTDSFLPWDLTEDELPKFQIFEGILPDSSRRPVMLWLEQALGGYTASLSTFHRMQVTIREHFTEPPQYGPGEIVGKEAVEIVAGKGDRVLMRAIDWVLSEIEHPLWDETFDGDAADLEFLLSRAGSSAMVTRVESNVVPGYAHYRLANRLPPGTEEAAEQAIEVSSAAVRLHMQRAWESFRQLEPDTSKSMAEAVKAAELAVRDAVAPRDGKPRMMKFVKQLEERTDWTLTLNLPSDDAFDPRSLVLQTLRCLALSQSDRHGGEAPPVAEAQAHLMLASLVVGWFESGAVVVPEKSKA